VLDVQGDWVKILFNGKERFVSASLVKIEEDSELAGYLREHSDLLTANLVPDKIIPVEGLTGKDLVIANTWNNYGGLIGTLADKLKVPAGAVIGTLVAESGGAAFASDGRLVIRFEVHLFYRHWGEQNQDIFNRFFSFDRSSAANGFKNHMWRPNVESEFQFFHGKSSREWEVLTFARALNDTAALKSISMGMSQVVGFNYRAIGYESVQQMFDQFARSAHAQILALFDYVKGPGSSSPVITAMQNGDFVAFARAYNGPANTAVYSERIKTNSDVFNRLFPTAKSVSAPVTTTRGPDGQSTEPAETPRAPVTPAPVVQPPSPSIVISTGDVRVRAKAVDGTVLKVLRAGESVTLLEPLEKALTKINAGQNGNQWLNIVTNENINGFVAAWLMKSSAPVVATPPAPAVETPPAPTPAPVVEAPPPPTNKAPVLVATTDVRVRAKAVDGTVLEVLRRGEPVTLLEPLDQAITKINAGPNGNQWLNVLTDENNKGFVGAWLMERSELLTKGDINTYIDSIPDQYPIAPVYDQFWTFQQRLGLPDPFDSLPVQVRTQSELANLVINSFGPNTFSSINWRNYYNGTCGMHNGFDFNVKTGTPLLAVSDGVIFKGADWIFMGSPFEKTVVLWPFLPKHMQPNPDKPTLMSNVLVAYAHTSDNSLKNKFDVVKVGEQIAISGFPIGINKETRKAAPEPGNAHLHMEVHLLSGFDSLLNPKRLGARKLLRDFDRPQPASNQVPWNPTLFFSKRLNKYMLHQSKTVGFYGRPSYPTPQTLQNLGASHLPPLDFFTLGYYEYGGGVVWVNSGKPWPAGVITADILSSRLQAFTPFEPYPATFLK
jgi:murein DD-endopeptidase MepM/ murein hydrolase activator NlpD